MSSPSIASYFNVRKRAANDDLSSARHKLSRLDSGNESSNRAQALLERAILAKNKIADAETFGALKPTVVTNNAKASQAVRTKAKPVVVRRSSRRQAKPSETESKESLKQPKIVKFTLGGSLSPRKKTIQPIEEAKPATPTKADVTKATVVNKSVSNTKRELSFDEIKSKIGSSSRLNDLKAILAKRQQLEEQYQACLSKKKALNSPIKSGGQSLKSFDTIELEVLSSPQKGLRTPTKTPVKTPSKDFGSGGKTFNQNDLMSPKPAATPRRLFSPTKAYSEPAYQRFQNLASDTISTTLQLPYKYRCLLEVFRSVDSICAMFYNRKETITFKKLRPAVQRMLRKNLTEHHLAQIKYLDPDAYHFEQRKMLNPGSHTKYDYYQLVITPNVQPKPFHTEYGIQKLDDNNIVRSADTKLMNPQIMIARIHRFQQILLDRVKHEHDMFLKNLQPPILIEKDRVRRWHQEFDLESCPDILPGELPQPPNIEKFSSAKDILSTARNLFNCATPNERIMERYEAACAANNAINDNNSIKTPIPNATSISTTTTTTTTQIPAVPITIGDAVYETPKPADDPVAKVLKGVPKALLDKIRAKQAAKQLDAMTRRPSQDAEACKYARLPELARYIRNIFVTENKGVLEMDKVIAKLGNSFREKMTREQTRELLELMAKEAPRNWLTFHFIRKTDFIKINRHENLAEIIQELERKASAKAE